MIRVSIITINLNNSEGLRKTLRSIIAQTFTDYELIVVDGGSIDGSIDVIQGFLQHYKIQHKWQSEPDDGIYQAMNKGIRMAEGEYCFFLNSGDYFVNDNVIENIFKKSDGSEIIYGNLIVLLNKRFVGRSKGNTNPTFHDIYAGMIKHQAAFIKRCLLEQYHYYNEKFKIVSDWEFFMKTAGLSSASLQYIDIDISYFDNNGLSNNNPDLCKHERQIVLNNLIPVTIQKDYLIFHKYIDIRFLEGSKTLWFLFRVLTKLAKIFQG